MASGAGLLDEVVRGIEVRCHVLRVHVRDLELEVPEARRQLHVLCGAPASAASAHTSGTPPRSIQQAASRDLCAHVGSATAAPCSALEHQQSLPSGQARLHECRPHASRAPVDMAPGRQHWLLPETTGDCRISTERDPECMSTWRVVDGDDAPDVQLRQPLLRLRMAPLPQVQHPRQDFRGVPV